MATGFLLIFFLLLSVVLLLSPPPTSASRDATPWPKQFHSVLVANNSGDVSIIDLWYDVPNGRNFNIIRKQLGEILYDLEWDNGTSFYYTLPPDHPVRCSTFHFPVGILRPNWMEGAEYLGQEKVGGFLCDVWTKADFIVYYEDVETRRPVHWVFTSTGRSIHVMTFEVGAVLEDEKWQAPPYCFTEKGKKSQSQQLMEATEVNFSMKNHWKGKGGQV